MDAATAEMAAQLRATYGLRTPDALHLGSAITSGCQVFLTNDADFKRVTEVRVVLLSEVQNNTAQGYCGDSRPARFKPNLAGPAKLE